MAKKTKKTIKKKKPAKCGIGVHCSYKKMVAVDTLKPNPENPNTHPEKQVDKLATIIKGHGWRHPIVVSRRSGLIVSGHCRLAAAQKLGLKKAPVDFQDFKSRSEERAVLLADNIVQEFAETDAEKMSDVMARLEKAKYNLDFTALDAKQIEGYMQKEEDKKDDVQIPETQNNVLVECIDEDEQKKCYELLCEKGFKCRLLTI
jgi:ParB-like chromosome segregation protein Spo0J